MTSLKKLSLEDRALQDMVPEHRAVKQNPPKPPADPEIQCLFITRAHHRALWITATSRATSLIEAVDECSAALKHVKQRSLCVVLMSPHFKASEVDNAPKQIFQRFNPEGLIGCVADVVGNAHGPALSISFASGSGSWTTFAGTHTSTQHGKYKSVGRWPAIQETGESASIENSDMTTFKSVSTGGNNVTLPPELMDSRKPRPDVLLLFADREPHRFTEHVDHHFPETLKIGLLGAMTPFLNGKPNTLFYNTEVRSAGIVGAALHSSQNHRRQELHFPGLVEIGEPLTITSCRGNIILGLDGSNAAREFLNCMTGRDMAPGVASERQLYVRVSQGQNSAVYCLTGGDPSKGALAIDTDKDLEEGMTIQFLHLNGENSGEPPAGLPGINFSVVPPDTVSHREPGRVGAELSDCITASSENGFIVGTVDQAHSEQSLSAAKGTWICDVPNAAIVADI
ncbi:hypothetical protein DFS34DRAFT_648819 [Phlyctochytrium arcticum]|nr:hypothetical protein DFS34DRAFT_648819 [Phlyctochytrium arcticum]